jgi:membrane protein YdbS with pleckstrin-like domain
VSTGGAWIVGDSLAQETTTNHPMPTLRASGYFLATLLGAYGLGFGALVLFAALPVWAVVFAALGVVASIVLFAILGSTQTNRHKAWVRNAYSPGADYPGNRFEKEPEAAARFGIYTMVIWIVAFVAFLVLGYTTGWAWSWLAFVGGFVVMMLMLARMLFGPTKS